MDTRDGSIRPLRAIEEADEIDRPYMREMAHAPTPLQRESGRVKRNDSCPCGSRKKFKRCCLFTKNQQASFK